MMPPSPDQRITNKMSVYTWFDLALKLMSLIANTRRPSTTIRDIFKLKRTLTFISKKDEFSDIKFILNIDVTRLSKMTRKESFGEMK